VSEKGRAAEVLTSMVQNQGAPLVGGLLADVARAQALEVLVVASVLWDLVDAGRLSYGTDARVRLTTLESAEVMDEAETLRWRYDRTTGLTRQSADRCGCPSRCCELPCIGRCSCQCHRDDAPENTDPTGDFAAFADEAREWAEATLPAAIEALEKADDGGDRG
jgi:hypothetical protein